MVLRSRTSLFFGVLATICIVANARGSQYSANMFLNGDYKNSVSSHPQYSVNPASNIFLEHAIISRQAAPFSGPTYLPPPQYIKCSNGQQCVNKNVCQNGFFTQKQSPIANCNPENNVCCTYRPPPTTQKPSVTCRRDQDCVSPADCQNGEIVSPNYIHGGSTSTCYSPNVCCLMPSTTLTKNGYQLKVPDTKFAFPKTPASTPPQPTYAKPSYPSPPQPKPTNEYLPPTQSTRYVPPPPPPPPLRSEGILSQPIYPQKPQKPQTSYQPPQPQQPQQQPQQPYQPQRPQTTPRSYAPQPAISTSPHSYQKPEQARRPPVPPNRDYLPPTEKDNEVPKESRTVPSRVYVPSPLKPLRGEHILSPSIVPQTSSPNAIRTPSKCASALVCTAEEYCNSIGVISDTPVDLSPAAKAFRVPLTDCNLPESGAPGKCCRDSNYVDPWPVNMAGVCGTRNRGTKPTGIADIDANFGEIPWQAMILKQSTKQLLCGGAIIGAEHVITTADCVRGLSESDARIKAGEWELGNDSEPLPFQLVGARYIKIHPTDDMAIIRLDKSLQFATHIKPICISDKDPSPSEKCITSGWGKQAIRTHEQGAIMHVTDTGADSRSACGANQGSVCGSTKFDSCQFDVGSALACGSSSSMLLKGIYSAENSCGEGQPVRFTKPDIKWINEEFNERNKAIFKKFN